MNWTTRVKPEISRQYKVDELHSLLFAPSDWPGKGPVVGLLIPECEMQVTILGEDGELMHMVNRPIINKDWKYWLRAACQKALDDRASLTVGCDTAQQAEAAAKIASKLLRGYKRIALEMLYAGFPNSRSEWH